MLFFMFQITINVVFMFQTPIKKKSPELKN